MGTIWMALPAYAARKRAPRATPPRTVKPARQIALGNTVPAQKTQWISSKQGGPSFAGIYIFIHI